MWDEVTFLPIIGTSIEEAASAATLYASFNKEQQFRIFLSFNGAKLVVADYDYKTREFNQKKSWEIIKQYDEWDHKEGASYEAEN